MNPPEPTPLNPLPEWHRNPFPKERTIPEGWDTSEWHAREESSRHHPHSPVDPNETGDTHHPARPEWYNPFPKPRTIPDGWDTSGWY